MSYDSQKLNRLLISSSWQIAPSCINKVLQKFSMTSPESSYTKIVANELSFLLVTHMTCFVIWFVLYGILKSGFSSGQIPERLGIQVLDEVFRPQDE
jgi:hypothetical protein